MGPVICFCWWFVWTLLTSVKLELKQQVFLACNPAGLIFESRTMVDCSRHMCAFCFVLLSLGSTCTVIFFFLFSSGPLVFCSHQSLPTFLMPQSTVPVPLQTVVGFKCQKHCEQQDHADMSTLHQKVCFYVVLWSDARASWRRHSKLLMKAKEKLNGTITIMATLQLFD